MADVPDISDDLADESPSITERTLVVVSVILTCCGYLYRYSDNNLRAFSQIYFEWGFTEGTAEIVVWVMEATLLLAIVSAPFRKLRFLTIPAFACLLFEILCLICDPGALYPYLTLPNQALRLAPFALILFAWDKKTVVWILKICIALTFIGHGIKALAGYVEFIDYLLAFFQLIHYPIEESSALRLLHVIGTIDIMLALQILLYDSRRIKWILFYMMFWGAVTAFSRIIYWGPSAWHEIAIRNAHFLIIFLLIYMLFFSNKKKEGSKIGS